MTINRSAIGLLSAIGATIFASHSAALELIMVEQPGCFYCDKWKAEIGPIYPKTDLAEAAPLRQVNVDDIRREGLSTKRAVFFTPTFLIVDDEGREINRLEGYQSEDFFWALTEKNIADAEKEIAE